MAHKHQYDFYKKTEHIIDYDYLESQNVTLIDYCQAAGISKDGFRAQMKVRLHEQS